MAKSPAENRHDFSIAKANQKSGKKQDLLQQGETDRKVKKFKKKRRTRKRH